MLTERLHRKLKPKHKMERSGVVSNTAGTACAITVINLEYGIYYYSVQHRRRKDRTFTTA